MTDERRAELARTVVGRGYLMWYDRFAAAHPMHAEHLDEDSPAGRVANDAFGRFLPSLAEARAMQPVDPATPSMAMDRAMRDQPTRDDLLGALMVAHDRLVEAGAGEDDEALLVVREALAGRSRWTTTDDWLPEDGRNVLASVPSAGFMVTAYLRRDMAGSMFESRRWRIAGSGAPVPGVVTHWMPLPKPPGEG